MTTANFLAFDLGAESGRAVVGAFDGEKLSLTEAHRFPNGPIHVLDSLYWSPLHLFSEMKIGLARTLSQVEGGVAAFGIDTWGVDFGLLDRDDKLIGLPYHYRDSRTDGLVEKAFDSVPRQEIFGQTGIQFMQLNTLIQLWAMVRQKSPALEIAQTLLMMPDLFNFWFTGQKSCEYTIASTSQCYNMAANTWARPMLAKLGVPTHIFLDVIQPGTTIGALLPAIGEEVGAKDEIPVIAPGCHDTASAVAAVPVADANQANYAYISSGTWSLMGAEIPAPVINERSLAYNFTNEGGVAQTIRLLKNLSGLWLVQECRRTWANQGQSLSYDELTHLAAAAPAFVALVDPDDAAFFAPGDMPGRIGEFCVRTGQTPLDSKGGVVRCALESLALKYRWGLERLEELTGRPIEVIHIVGGGSQNRLLNQFTANATGKRVVTGPIEATAIGNILLQMLAVGRLGSLSEGRDLVRRSFPVESYEPEANGAWTEAYRRFVKLLPT
jgi:rhamnulokinase